MKNWLVRTAEELVGDLVITALAIAVSIILRGIDLTIRALIGPQFEPIVWVLLMFVVLVAISTYLIRQGNQPA
jgi:hypothetical protein